MNDSSWPVDFDPTDPELAEETCRVCGEPASFALFLDAAAAGAFGSPAMVCKVCEHYVGLHDLDSLIARSPDAGEETDRLAGALIGHSSSAVAFQHGYDTHDSWD